MCVCVRERGEKSVVLAVCEKSVCISGESERRVCV